MFRHMLPDVTPRPRHASRGRAGSAWPPRRPRTAPGCRPSAPRGGTAARRASGLSAHAVPTARTARGLPASVGHLRVAGGAPVRDVGQVQDDVTAEAAQQLQVERHVEAWSVGRRSTRRARGRRRRAGPGASSTRGLTCSASAGQHGVVVLHPERHPDQTGRRARQEQRARPGCRPSGRRRRAGPRRLRARAQVPVQVRRGRRRAIVRCSYVMTPPGRSWGRSAAGWRRRPSRRGGRRPRCRRRARRRRRRAARRGGGRRRRAAAWWAARRAPPTGRGRGPAAASTRSGTSATGTAWRAARRTTSIALRCAIVTSHASTFASAGSSG